MNAPYWDILVAKYNHSPSVEVPVGYLIRLDVARLNKIIVAALTERQSKMPLRSLRVIVGHDIIKECAVGFPEEIQMDDFYSGSFPINGCPVALAGWATGVLVIPA